MGHLDDCTCLDCVEELRHHHDGAQASIERCDGWNRSSDVLGRSSRHAQRTQRRAGRTVAKRSPDGSDATDATDLCAH